MRHKILDANSGQKELTLKEETTTKSKFRSVSWWWLIVFWAKSSIALLVLKTVIGFLLCDFLSDSIFCWVDYLSQGFVMLGSILILLKKFGFAIPRITI